MEPRSNDAAVKDAQINSSREECVAGMGPRSNENHAAVKDAQIDPSKEECARGTGRRTR